MTARRTLASLEAGRGLAALAVVISHAAGNAASFNPDVPHALVRGLHHGYLGVDFFFVLSGFIIYHVHAGRGQLAEFWLGRLRRIFIPYLPVGIGMAMLYTLLPQVSAASRDWSWFASLTLLPSPSDTALIVAWTLRHELVFYGAFGIFLALGRPLAGCLAWAVAIVAANIVARPAETAFVVGAINLEFVFGVAAAASLSRPRVRLCLAGGALSALAFLLTGERLLLGAALAFAMPLVAGRELRRGMAVPSALVGLGSASYAIYLVHAPVMSVIARIPLPWPVLVAACILAGVLAGIAYHLAFERPALRFARGTPRPADRPAVAG